MTKHWAKFRGAQRHTSGPMSAGVVPRWEPRSAQVCKPGSGPPRGGFRPSGPSPNDLQGEAESRGGGTEREAPGQQGALLPQAAGPAEPGQAGWGSPRESALPPALQSGTPRPREQEGLSQGVNQHLRIDPLLFVKTQN